MIVWSPKLVSIEDRTRPGLQLHPVAPAKEVAPLQTVTLVPVQIKYQKFHKHLAVHIGTNQGLSNDPCLLPIQSGHGPFKRTIA